MKYGIVTLSCNQLHLTNNLMSDIKRETNEDYTTVVVDNGGLYARQGDEYIIKPPFNTRWVIGVNMAIKFLISNEKRLGFKFDGFFCLNDDIRLSPGFFDGILEAKKLNPSAGLIAPAYDDVHPQQRSAYTGAAHSYRPIERDDEVKWFDGTAFYVPRPTYSWIGGLDEQHFGVYGWGSDIDYCYRTRVMGDVCLVTHRAFINHFHQGSAKFVEDDWSGKAGAEMQEGMRAKYGQDWRQIVY